MWTTLLAAATTLASTSSATNPVPPGNVIVIVIDDVGCDLVGCYESYFRGQGRPAGTPANTPAIDTLLASRGILFANAWTAPVCSPSRARVLTGRYGFRTGMGCVLKEDPDPHHRNPGLTEDQVLLPEILHVAPTPYTCVAVGKWHLADVDQVELNPTHPLGAPVGRWFDRYAGAMFNLQQAVPGSPQSIYFSWIKHYASYIDIGVNPCLSGQPPCDVPWVSPPVTRYASVDTTEDALRMVQTLPEPWFLYVAYNAAHLPAHQIPPGLPQTSCANYVPNASPCDPGPSSTVADRVRCVMEELDNQIGRLVCAVDDTDTTVILMGDNGSDRNAVLPPFDPLHAKGSLYEEGVRVPLIIRSPLQLPVTVGTVNTALVSSTDVFATVAKIAKVDAQTSATEDSISMVPYLYGLTGSRRETVYSETFLQNFRPDPVTGLPPTNYMCSRHSQTIRDERFKLLRRWRRDHVVPNLITMTEEFFDLLQGGPPDTSTVPPTPTPDWFEEYDLLANGGTPTGVAARSLERLRRELDVNYRTLVR